MPKFDQKIFRERYEKLPSDLREAIFSEENADKIQEISKKYSLYVDKMGELAEESGLVMLGFTHPKDFIKNLSERLGVDAEKAKEIAKDVNEQIFGPVRESLKKLHKISEEEIPETQNLKPETQEIKEVKPTVEMPIKTEETKPIEEKEIPEGIQRAPKQFREIKEEVLQAKEEAKYLGGIDPYKEPIE